MQKLDFGFVILHYMAQQMTEDCVDDLLAKFSDKNIKIVIVDNASKNNSGKFLEEKYANNNLVKVIINKKNLGFARGNNIGFDYLKNNYNVDFMIVMNNDVFIKSQDFLEKIVELYQKHKYAVLGPDIFAPNLNRHQNPLEYNIPTVDGCKYWINVYKKLIRKDNFNYYKLKFLHYAVYSWAKPIAKIFFPNKFKNSNVQPQKETQKPLPNQAPKESKTLENIVLQGSCFIFSKDFISKRNYAFYPETFLYFEEHILALQCFRENLKTLYYPQIEVEHLHSVSTKTVYKTQREKYLLYWRENIKSLKIYIKLFEEYERKNNR